MDKPTAPEPSSGGATTPLSFNLNEAAALCGVSTREVCEWTACGYVCATGQGEHRRYDRDALKQIVALRDAVRAGQLPGERRGPATQMGIRDSKSAEDWRSTEFLLPSTPMDDSHLMLQTEMFFALNAGSGADSASLARYFGVEPERIASVLDTMVQSRHLIRVHQGAETLFRAARTHLHGPSIREQRIRAAKRQRQPSRHA